MTDRLSTQELDDVLAAHYESEARAGVCSPCWWANDSNDAGEPNYNWPCLDYRLARDLKAALKEDECFEKFYPALHEFRRSALRRLLAYDTEETISSKSSA